MYVLSTKYSWLTAALTYFIYSPDPNFYPVYTLQSKLLSDISSNSCFSGDANSWRREISLTRASDFAVPAVHSVQSDILTLSGSTSYHNHNVELDEKTRSVIGNRSPLEDAGAGVTDGHVASEQNQDEQEERGRRRRTPSLSSSATALCRHRGRGGAAAEAVVVLEVVQMM